jgi:hypothetical protein
LGRARTARDRWEKPNSDNEQHQGPPKSGGPRATAAD